MLNSAQRRITPSLVISCIALLIALSSPGAAATAKSFLLGKTNSASKTTALKSAAKNGTLKLTNSGTGPAASFNTAAGVAPFKVNRSAKVTNLNADQLDGLNSTAFLKSGPGFVTSASILDDTEAGGGLSAADLNPDSVGFAEIQTDGVQASEIADNSIDSGEIVDFGLTNEDVGVLFAQVNGDGTLAGASSGGTSSLRLGAGTYQVAFPYDVSGCAGIAVQGEAGVGGAAGAILGVTDRSGNANAYFVTVRDNTNALADRAFQIIAVC